MDTINRLVNDNRDFQYFLNDLMEDIKVGKVKSIYDEIYEDEEDASCQSLSEFSLVNQFLFAILDGRKWLAGVSDNFEFRKKKEWEIKNYYLIILTKFIQPKWELIELKEI